MEQFLAFCEANGLNPMSRKSKAAFKDSQAPGGSKRSYTPKTQTLVGLAPAEEQVFALREALGDEIPEEVETILSKLEGAMLVRSAVGIETRDLPGASDVLKWQLVTEDGADRVSFAIEYEPSK